MKNFSFALCFFSFFLSSPGACALDTAAVKAVRIMQVSSSWDGAPIKYPAGKAEVTGMIMELAPGAEGSTLTTMLGK